MVRSIVLALVCAAMLTSCGRKDRPAEASDAEQRKAMEDYARRKMPVLDRTMVMNDLGQIHLYLDTARSGGRWPKDMNAAKEMMSKDLDMRKLLAQIEDGTYVIVGNPPDGGILAYCSKETTVGLISVSTSKEFNQHKPEELQKILAQQRR